MNQIPLKRLKIPLIDTNAFYFKNAFKEEVLFYSSFIRIKSDHTRYFHPMEDGVIPDPLRVELEVDILKEMVGGATVLKSEYYGCYEVSFIVPGDNIRFFFNKREFAYDFRDRVIQWITEDAI